MTRAVPLSALPSDVRAKLSKQTPRGKGKKTLMTENAKRLRDATEQARVEQFFAVLTRAKLPLPLREVQFHAARKWRFDYCWPAQKVALEVEGGLFVSGRHGRGAGARNDIEKYNAATLAGYRVLRVLPESLTTRTTEEMLRRCLK